ncbi:DMT family transporter [Methylobacterium sp. Leaf104]|uniref:DMT family transporter n=1 Tax=Methylobacterium sp. Leaf104 TaxID=1736254 RepID=UPI003FA5A81B
MESETGGAASKNRRLAGIALMCGTLAFFACLDASAKTLAGRGVDPLLSTFMRYAVNVTLVLMVLNPIRTPGVARTNRLTLQVLRSLLLFGSTALNFLALRKLQLAETLSIQFATPLMVALLAGPLLGEWSSPRRLVAVAVGFLGVLVIVRPGVDAFQPAVLLSIGNMLCYAFYVLTTRKLASVDSTATTVFYSGLAGLAVMSPLLPWIWTTPTAWSTWALLVGVGLFGTLGHWLLVLAHARAPANVLAPFIYTQLLWSVMLGYLIFGDVPNRWTLIGASIVIGSGLYLLTQESTPRARRRPDARPATQDPASPQR